MGWHEKVASYTQIMVSAFAHFYLYALHKNQKQDKFFLHIDVLPFLIIIFIDFIVFRYSSRTKIMHLFGGIYDMH